MGGMGGVKYFNGMQEEKIYPHNIEIDKNIRMEYNSKRRTNIGLKRRIKITQWWVGI